MVGVGDVDHHVRLLLDLVNCKKKKRFIPVFIANQLLEVTKKECSDSLISTASGRQAPSRPNLRLTRPRVRATRTAAQFPNVGKARIESTKAEQGNRSLRRRA